MFRQNFDIFISSISVWGFDKDAPLYKKSQVNVHVILKITYFIRSLFPTFIHVNCKLLDKKNYILVSLREECRSNAVLDIFPYTYTRSVHNSINTFSCTLRRFLFFFKTQTFQLTL